MFHRPVFYSQPQIYVHAAEAAPRVWTPIESISIEKRKFQLHRLLLATTAGESLRVVDLRRVVEITPPSSARSR